MMPAEEIRTLIEQALDGARVEVRDATGSGDHFEAIVVAGAFEGKTRVQQHQLVYAALGDRMRQRIHALALKTLTPAEWEKGGHAGGQEEVS
jgi:acid stress-induced BolA-like protein IbaG/YrbA